MSDSVWIQWATVSISSSRVWVVSMTFLAFLLERRGRQQSPAIATEVHQSMQIGELSVARPHPSRTISPQSQAIKTTAMTRNGHLKLNLSIRYSTKCLFSSYIASSLGFLFSFCFWHFFRRFSKFMASCNRFPWLNRTASVYTPVQQDRCRWSFCLFCFVCLFVTQMPARLPFNSD